MFLLHHNLSTMPAFYDYSVDAVSYSTWLLCESSLTFGEASVASIGSSILCKGSYLSGSSSPSSSSKVNGIDDFLFQFHILSSSNISANFYLLCERIIQFIWSFTHSSFTFVIEFFSLNILNMCISNTHKLSKMINKWFSSTPCFLCSHVLNIKGRASDVFGLGDQILVWNSCVTKNKRSMKYGRMQ